MADVPRVAVEEEDDPAAARMDPPPVEAHAVGRREAQILRAQTVAGRRRVEPPEREVKKAVFQQAHELRFQRRKTRMRIDRAIAFAVAALSVVVAAEGSSFVKSKSMQVTYYYLPG